MSRYPSIERRSGEDRRKASRREDWRKRVVKTDRRKIKDRRVIPTGRRHI